ncbi:MAG: hypothetical protein BWY87_01298 [Deltaproteobacteria bacterium ADurb.Bin510]|nr:MAG: hypothetical protein BWY87_01298 [Deltaproteobacteria bacterium ADurb.Bin510]
MALVVVASRRAISPGCGVRMPSALKQQGQPARMFSPSASITAGQLSSLMSLATNSAVAGREPRPGPITTASLARLNSAASGSMAGVNQASSGWPMGRVMTSFSLTARIGFRPAGQARVTRPAPLRAAAWAARQAAPVRPWEPATRLTRPKSPLWASIGRWGRFSSTRGCSRRTCQAGSSTLAGIEMSRTASSPTYWAPLASTMPTLG